MRTFLLGLCTLLLAACPAGPDDSTPDGGGGTGAWSLSRVIDLGAECVNAGALAVDGRTAYVACGGDFSGNGQLAIVDLDTDTVTLVAVGGAPGTVALGSELVYLGDMLDGRVLTASRAGAVANGADDPVVLCPSDWEGGIYQFVADVEVYEGALYASCFATDEVVRFEVSPGATDGAGAVTNALVQERAVAGDGLSTLRGWKSGELLGLDNLAGTLSHITTTPLAAVASYWSAGEVPNDLHLEGDAAWVVNSGSNTLQVLDLVGSTTVQEVFLGEGANPWAVARAAADTALVTLQLLDEVAVVDLTSGTVTARIPMPTGEALMPFEGMEPAARPQGIALAGSGEAVVSLTNFDASYQPAGHGLLAVLAREAE